MSFIGNFWWAIVNFARDKGYFVKNKPFFIMLKSNCQTFCFMLALKNTKGVSMNVSAVSVAQVTASVSNKSYKQNNLKNDKNIKETSSSTSNSYITPKDSVNDKSAIFDVINEWKDFCHKQILNGQIDVIV